MISIQYSHTHTPIAGDLIGSLVVADRVKPKASSAIQALHALGLKVVLLTGDNWRTAQAIGREVGIPDKNVFAQVLPSHKKNKIIELQRNRQKVKGFLVTVTGC